MEINANYKTYRRKLARAAILARKEKGWTMEKLIAKGDNEFSIRTVCNIESAKYDKDLTLSTIEKVFDTLGIAVRLELGSK